MQYSRLADPFGAAKDSRQFAECAERINATLTRMFRGASNGGNPFLFALTAPKPHKLARQVGSRELTTAATNGREFHWNPDFLESLSPDEVQTVMSHEAYHVLFYHCTVERSGGLDPMIWNVAVDYTVNATIEVENEQSGRNQKVPTPWTGPLGQAISLQMLLDHISGKVPKLPHGCFADRSLYGRSPESIYQEIIKARQQAQAKSGRGQQPGQPGQQPGDDLGSLDAHLPTEMTREEIQGDMMRAADQARAIGRGTVPASIEEALARLSKPELSARDLIRCAIAQRVRDAGNMNDYKRFRRRPSYIYSRSATGAITPAHRLFEPKKFEFRPRWICLMDTSGSMTDEDIARGVKELQLIANSEGWIVPCDAQPYWDKATRVTDKTSLQKTRVVGRGGTTFEQFFAELPAQRLSDRFDLVIIITDGDCDQVPRHLMPKGADCLWIITNKRQFQPNFGRVAHLNR